MRSVTAALLLVATVAGAQPARVGCGPAAAGCGPAQILGGTTTTTLPGAPSWVSSMVAAWMLDEASGATRVNAQGTTSRDLTGGALQNTSIFMEGIASADFSTTGHVLQATDATINALTTYTIGCWARPTAGTVRPMEHVCCSPNRGFYIDYFSGSANINVFDSAGTNHAVNTGSTALNTWVHLAGTYASPTVKSYKNGVLANSDATVTGALPATLAFTLSTGGFQYAGQLDECFIAGSALSAASVCRICSCGIRGEQCACNGAAFTSTGRNATACGSCTLPADCSAAAPS